MKKQTSITLTTLLSLAILSIGQNIFAMGTFAIRTASPQTPRMFAAPPIAKAIKDKQKNINFKRDYFDRNAEDSYDLDAFDLLDARNPREIQSDSQFYKKLLKAIGKNNKCKLEILLTFYKNYHQQLAIDINYDYEYGRTALWYAVMFADNEDLTTKLIAAGANDSFIDGTTGKSIKELISIRKKEGRESLVKLLELTPFFV